MIPAKREAISPLLGYATFTKIGFPVSC